MIPPSITPITAAGHAGQVTTIVAAVAVIIGIIAYAAFCDMVIAMQRAVWERDQDESEAALIHDLARIPDRLDEIAELEHWI